MFIFFNFHHLSITLQSSDLFWGTKFRALSLLLHPLIFSYLQALIHGFLWWWGSSWLIFSLKWRLLSTLLLLHSTSIKIQEAKDYIDEENPKPTSSNGATSTYLYNTMPLPLWVGLFLLIFRDCIPLCIIFSWLLWLSLAHLALLSFFQVPWQSGMAMPRLWWPQRSWLNLAWLIFDNYI